MLKYKLFVVPLSEIKLKQQLVTHFSFRYTPPFSCTKIFSPGRLSSDFKTVLYSRWEDPRILKNYDIR